MACNLLSLGCRSEHGGKGYGKGARMSDDETPYACARWLLKQLRAAWTCNTGSYRLGGTGPALTYDELTGLAAQYRRGASIFVLAKLHGLHPFSIRRYLKRMGYQPRHVLSLTRRTHRRATRRGATSSYLHLRTRAQNLRQQKLPYRVIAERLSVPPTIAYRLVNGLHRVKRKSVPRGTNITLEESPC